MNLHTRYSDFGSAQSDIIPFIAILFSFAAKIHFMVKHFRA